MPAAYCDILKLVWPLALGMINNAIMQFVDRAYLAHDSMVSLEAVLPASMLSWIFLGFFQSVVGYSGVFVSQYHGAGDEAKCAASYRAGQAIAWVSGLLMLPLLPLGNWIFAQVASSPELLAGECDYYDVVTLGGFFVFGQMAAVAYFTGRGRTRIVFWVNVLGNLLNIALDPLLIFGADLGFVRVPALGISGAAYATVFAMALQWLVLARLIRRVLVPSPFDWRLLTRILRFGVPSGGYSVLNILSFTVFVFVTGTVGDVAFAASNACFTINYLLFAPMEGFALGAQTIVAQALGRGDPDGAVRSFRRTVLLALSFVGFCCLLVIACHRPVLSLFAPADLAARTEFMSLGFELLILMSAWIFFDASDVILSGALKGAGDTKFVFAWMFLSAFLVWLPLVFVVRRFAPSMTALWLTMVFFVVFISVGSFVRWNRGRWRKIRMVR